MNILSEAWRKHKKKPHVTFPDLLNSTLSYEKGGKMWNELWFFFFLNPCYLFHKSWIWKKKKKNRKISMINNISIPFFLKFFLPLYRLYCLCLDYVIVNAGKQSSGTKYRSGTKNDYPAWVKFIVLFKNNLFAMNITSYTL